MLMLSVGIGGSASWAQETGASDTIIVLDESQVIGGLTPVSPFAFSSISKDEAEELSLGREPSFLLARTPGVTNYSDAGSEQGYSYFRIRGMDQTRVNITVDGVPMNEPEDQGAYFSNYPDLLRSMGGMQITRGVGISRNGMASYAGSVNLRTATVDSTWTGVGLGYGSWNSFRSHVEHHQELNGGVKFQVRLSELFSDGYKERSGNHSQSATLGVDVPVGKHHFRFRSILGHQQNEMAWLGVSDSLLTLNPRHNANAEEDDEFTQGLTYVQWTAQAGKKGVVQATVYYTFLDGNYDFDLNNFLGLPSSEELYNYAFDSDFTGGFVYYKHRGESTDLTLGTHVNSYSRQHLGSELALGELYVNTGFKQEHSAFAKVERQLGSFEATLDLQYRQVGFSYEGAVDLTPLDWDFINPRFGLARVGDGSTWYYSVGMTGREPTRNDMFGGYDDLLPDGSGDALLFSTEAESVVDHELGWRMERERATVGANLYFMDFENEIVLNGNFGPNGLALTDNVDRSFRTGLELDAAVDLGLGLIMTSATALSVSRIEEEGVVFQPILSPALISFNELSYRENRWSLALNARFQSASFLDFANTVTLDGYAVLGARVGYTRGNARIGLRLENLTNARYFNHGYVDFDGSAKYFIQNPLGGFLSLQQKF